MAARKPPPACEPIEIFVYWLTGCFQCRAAARQRAAAEGREPREDEGLHPWLFTLSLN